MAKYTVTFKCGHEEEVQLVGKHSDRERKISWFENNCECSKCKQDAQAEKMAAKFDVVEMHYGEYKRNFANNKTVAGSYDSKPKTIKVYVEKSETEEVQSVSAKKETFKQQVQGLSKSEIFKNIHAWVNQIKIANPSIDYRAQFSICLKAFYEEVKLLMVA